MNTAYIKKSTIWLLVGVMVFAFIGLLYVQINYISIILDTQENQFKDAVKRSLYQVSYELELDEAGQFLAEQYFYSGENYFGGRNHPLFVDKTNKNISTRMGRNFSGGMDSLATVFPSFGRNTMNSAAQSIKEAQDLYLYAQNMVEELVRRIRRSYERPIEERIDYRKLEVYIQRELENNGLVLPFVFAILDKDKNSVYHSSDYQVENLRNVYSQILFPRDPASRFYTLQVVFPTQKKYVFDSISFILPSIIFTIVLLVVFLLTMYILFRQKRLSEIKNDFINNMTHELKTPVASISLAAQTLNDEEVNKSPKLMEYAKKVISDESKRLGFLVEKVLQMSLFEDRATQFNMVKLDANDLISDISATFELRVSNIGGTLDIDLEALDSMIVVDKMHFTNVLFNLMENAVKYRKQDIPLLLMLRTLNVGNNIQIRIEDNGMGIRKESLKKIFDRFYRVPTGNRHDVKGFGLGLAYVKRIVTELGGTIKAESEYGEGTDFIITLPYVDN